MEDEIVTTPKQKSVEERVRTLEEYVRTAEIWFRVAKGLAVAMGLSWAALFGFVFYVGEKARSAANDVHVATAAAMTQVKETAKSAADEAQQRVEGAVDKSIRVRLPLLELGLGQTDVAPTEGNRCPPTQVVVGLTAGGKVICRPTGIGLRPAS
jgi:hypothetical protein